MKVDVLTIIDKEYIFLELIGPIFQKDDPQFTVWISAEYLDEVCKMSHIIQYELTLNKADNWKIVNVK